MHIKILNDNIADQNAYLLINGKIAIVIDPGFNGQAIIEAVAASQAKVTDVLLTHGHFDHIRDVALMGKQYRFTLHIHEADEPLLHDDRLNYARSFHSQFNLPKDLVVVKHRGGDWIEAAGEKIRLVHTPGHTSGSVCYQLNGRLFTGDTLFSDGVGRTDLYGGSVKELRVSLSQILTGFSHNTEIYPGHGAKAKLGTIKNNNPYL